MSGGEDATSQDQHIKYGVLLLSKFIVLAECYGWYYKVSVKGKEGYTLLKVIWSRETMVLCREVREFCRQIIAHY